VAPLAGRPGFRALGHCRDEGGPGVQVALAWTVAGERVWFVSYAAPARHHFPQDLDVFEQAVVSLAVEAPAAGR
jgi:hypothetical protein